MGKKVYDVSDLTDEMREKGMKILNQIVAGVTLISKGILEFNVKGEYQLSQPEKIQELDLSEEISHEQIMEWCYMVEQGEKSQFLDEISLVMLDVINFKF